MRPFFRKESREAVAPEILVFVRKNRVVCLALPARPLNFYHINQFKLFLKTIGPSLLSGPEPLLLSWHSRKAPAGATFQTKLVSHFVYRPGKVVSRRESCMGEIVLWINPSRPTKRNAE